jgi:HlyD family secretion protein
MKKKLIWLITLVILILLIFLFVPLHSTPPPKTVTVQQGAIKEQVIAVGQLEPLEVSKVKTNLGGQVGQIYVQEGSYVKQGDKLLTVVPSTTPDKYVDAAATVSQAKADLIAAESTFKRDKLLIGKHLVTMDQYDQDQQRYQHMLSVYQQAQEQFALLQSGKTVASGKFLDSTVYSPISGYILQKNIYEGDSVTASTDYQTGTVLFVIAKIKPLIFMGEVSQLDANQVKPGMTASVEVASFPGKLISGTVSNVSLMDINETNNGLGQANDTGDIFDMPDVYTHGFKIEISDLKFPPQIELRAGYQATATIVTQEKKNILVLPQRVVHFNENNQAYVWLSGDGKSAVKQNVEVGLSDNVNVEITSGVQVDEAILDQ